MPPRGQPRQPFACLRFPLHVVVVVVGVDVVDVVGVDIVVFGVDIVVLGVVLMLLACYIFIQHHLLMFSIEKTFSYTIIYLAHLNVSYVSASGGWRSKERGVDTGWTGWTRRTRQEGDIATMDTAASQLRRSPLTLAHPMCNVCSVFNSKDM